MEMDKKPQKNVQNENQRQSRNALARYSGMAFQIGGSVVIGVVVGKWLDKQFEAHHDVFTILFSILGVFAGLYLVIKDIIKK